jgi:adhesin transport system outer membrane protein
VEEVFTISRLHKQLFLAAAALCLPANVAAQPLSVALGSLVESHPRIQADRERAKVSHAAIKEARAGYYPTVDVNASYGYENTDRTKLLVAAGEFDLNPTAASLSVSQNLFEGYRTHAAVDSALVQRQIASATLTSTTQQVMFEGISHYLSVLRQLRVAQLSKKNIQTLQDQLNMEDEKVQRGSGVAVDVLQAKSRLQIAKERFTAFSGQLRDAISRYVQIFGDEPDLQALALPSMPLNYLPKNVEEARRIALENSPLLLANRLAVQVSEHQKTSSKAGYYPSIDLNASTNFREDAGGIQGEEYSNVATISATWQLFSGFADQARVKQAVHGHQAALASAQDAQRQVEQEVKLAWSNLTISRERAELLENAVNIAGEVYDARKRLRDTGKETALNVLDAENELFRAQIDATAARYDYYTAIFRLLLSMGTLQPEMVMTAQAKPAAMKEQG